VHRCSLLLQTIVNPTKTAEPTEMPFGLWSWVGPRNRVLDVSWQQHMTNEELYGKIPSAMHQLRERRLTFAGNCYRCEDQPVKHLVLWEGRAGKMLRGQTTRMTYVKQLLHEQHDSCCEMIHELQRMIKNRVEWARVSHTTSSSE